jgi:hypothetical protein
MPATRSVIRHPCEEWTREGTNVRLIRVNMDHAETPHDLADRAVGFSGDADAVIGKLFRARAPHPEPL